MALITTQIPTSNLELVRDRIADILRLELTYQGTLDNTFVVPNVYVSRVNDPDKTQLPCINVWIAKADYSNPSQRAQHGMYMFMLDIYASSPAKGNVTGDELAGRRLDKIGAMVRYILMSPVYRTLGFEPSVTNGIEQTEVQGFQISPHSLTEDALSSMMMQMAFSAKVPEGVALQTGEEFELAISTQEIGNTGNGYQIGASNA